MSIVYTIIQAGLAEVKFERELKTSIRGKSFEALCSATSNASLDIARTLYGPLGHHVGSSAIITAATDPRALVQHHKHRVQSQVASDTVSTLARGGR